MGQGPPPGLSTRPTQCGHQRDLNRRGCLCRRMPGTLSTHPVCVGGLGVCHAPAKAFWVAVLPQKVSLVSGRTHTPQVPLDKAGPSVCTRLPVAGRQHIRGCPRLVAHIEARDTCSTGQGPRKEPRAQAGMPKGAAAVRAVGRKPGVRRQLQRMGCSAVSPATAVCASFGDSGTRF